MHTTINQELVDTLYNPDASGLEILSQHIDLNKLKKINQFIHENNHTFEEKREKYIKNNQKVALLYRGGFDTSALEDTIFKDLLNTYKDMREQIAYHSAIPFEQGSSLEVKLIYYPVSELGVGIHKDLSSNVNLIVFFNLEGTSDVKTYSTKEGLHPVSHPITQGDISLMRGPRLNEVVDIRPYHAVEEVYEPRTVMVIREINEELEKVTNKDNWRGF
jgi:hypothetical protein